MKKFLSLVLALVMTMSLVTVSAGAKDFGDNGDIDYKEAVDVISALGIVDGYSDGSFRPDGSLTRGAAAKIICNLILGPTTASALSATTAPFKDVPVTNTFAGYITYCSQQGIISGYGDGTFRPTGSLTGNAFMKMLLGALGYDSSIEGYTGSNWQVNVVKQAVGIGLDDGNDNFVGSRTVTRQEAALYAFNMLQATMVEYDTKSTIVVGGVEINTTSSRDQVAFAGGKGSSTDGNIEEDGYVQFAERYFTSLKATPDKDEFQRPATTWRYNNRAIGTYTDEADETYTAKVELTDVYADLGLNESTKATEQYVDGKEVAEQTLVRRDNDNTKVTDSGNGVLTQVWYEEDERGNVEYLIISAVNTYVAEVSRVTNDGEDDRTITLDAYSKNPNSLDRQFETQDFDVDDLVVYTASWNDNTRRYEVQTVEALEDYATGTLTEWNGKNLDTPSSTGKSENNFTVGGTTYDYSANYIVVNEDGGESEVWEFAVDESELNVYVDQYGYAIYVDGVEAEKNYAVVIGVGSTNPYGSETNGVTLMMPDGTRVEVEAKYTASHLTTPISNKVNEKIGDIVTYKVDDDGVYELTVAGTGTAPHATGNSGANTAYTNQADEVQFVNGRSLFVLNDKDTSSTRNFFATEDTIFVVGTYKNGKNTTDGFNYDVYVGYENMPSIDTTVVTDAVAYVTNSEYSTQLDVVYIATKQLAGISAVDTYFVKEKNEDIITNSQGSYYVLPAIVDGEETEVKVDATFSAVDNNSTEYGLFAITNVVTDKNGIITSFYDVTSSVFDAEVDGVKGSTSNTTSSIAGVVRANGGVIGIGNKGNKNTAEYYAYNSDTVAYYVDKDYKDIQIVNITSLTDDDNDLVYGIQDELSTSNWKKLDTIVVVEKPDVVKSSDTTLKSLKFKGLDVKASDLTDVDYEVVISDVANNSGVDTTTIEKNDADQDVETVYYDSAADAKNNTNPKTWQQVHNTALPADDYYVKFTVTAADGTSTDSFVVKVTVLPASNALLESSNLNAVVTTTPSSEAITVSNSPTVADLYAVLSVKDGTDNAGNSASFKIVNAWGTPLSTTDTTQVATGMKVVLTRDNHTTPTVEYDITVNP